MLESVRDTLRRQLLEQDKATVWHITSKKSADNIVRGGFKPQQTMKGSGVSVSVSKPAAKGLLATARRMFSFKTAQQVADWFVKMGAPRDEVVRAMEYNAKDRRPWKRGPAGLYVSLMGEHHDAVGGNATKIPRNEFLWSDIGNNLVQQGPPIVAVEADYAGPVQQFAPGAIEAELFVTDTSMLTPKRIVTSI